MATIYQSQRCAMSAEETNGAKTPQVFSSIHKSKVPKGSVYLLKYSDLEGLFLGANLAQICLDISFFFNPSYFLTKKQRYAVPLEKFPLVTFRYTTTYHTRFPSWFGCTSYPESIPFEIAIYAMPYPLLMTIGLTRKMLRQVLETYLSPRFIDESTQQPWDIAITLLSKENALQVVKRVNLSIKTEVLPIEDLKEKEEE